MSTKSNASIVTERRGARGHEAQRVCPFFRKDRDALFAGETVESLFQQATALARTSGTP